MKGMLRRISALLLAAVLVLGMGVTARADSLSTTTVSVSIAGAADADTKVVTNTKEVTISKIPVAESETNPGTYEVEAEALGFATYQVAYATYDQDSNSLEYHLTPWAYAALVASTWTDPTSTGPNDDGQYQDEAAALAALVASKLIGTTASQTTDGNSAEEQSAVVNTLAAYVKNAEKNSTILSPAKDTAVGGTSSLKWAVNENSFTSANVTSGTTATASLPVGAYLILPSSENMAFLNMMVSVDVSGTTGTSASDWTLAAKDAVLKGSLISIDKEVSASSDMSGKSDSEQAQVGDTLYFSITVDVPKFAENSSRIVFKVTDTPANMKIKESSVKVQAYTGQDTTGTGTGLTAATNYTASVNDSTGVLTVDFSSQYLSTFYTNGTYPYEKVKITYEAELLSSALASGGNSNEATLTYGNDPDDTKDNEVSDNGTKVYTYQMNLAKYGETGTTKLSNASFIISENRDFSNPLSFTGSNGSFALADSTVADADKVSAVKTDADGALVLTGLDADTTYYIKESVAPSGYSLNNNYLAFTITEQVDSTSQELTGLIGSVSATEYSGNGTTVETYPLANGKTSDGSWTINVDTETVGTATSNTASLTLTLTDTQLPSLPATGSVGIIIFTIAGVALMIAAVFIIFSGRNREKSGGERA